MSLDSPADIIPFTRFLECRQRRHRIALANATCLMPASTDVGIRLEETGTSNLAHYALVSTQPDVDVPAPANLSAVFDHFALTRRCYTTG